MERWPKFREETRRGGPSRRCPFRTSRGRRIRFSTASRTTSIEGRNLPVVRLGKGLPRPIVAGDVGGETIERGARIIQDQGDRVDRPRQGVVTPRAGSISNGAPHVDSKTGRGFGKGDRPALSEPAARTHTSGLRRLGKGRSQLRRPYVGARNSPRNQPAVSLDSIGSTSATTR
jgi:hypothetical protein